MDNNGRSDSVLRNYNSIFYSSESTPTSTANTYSTVTRPYYAPYMHSAYPSAPPFNQPAPDRYVASNYGGSYLQPYGYQTAYGAVQPSPRGYQPPPGYQSASSQPQQDRGNNSNNGSGWNNNNCQRAPRRKNRSARRSKNNNAAEDAAETVVNQNGEVDYDFYFFGKTSSSQTTVPSSTLPEPAST